MSDTTQDTAGGVRSTSVKVTLNAKSLGVDAFISLEETHEFTELASDFDALETRQGIAEVLLEQALAQVKMTADAVQKYAAENPRGHVSVHAVNPTAPAGVAAGTVASGPIVQQVQQVANGAATTAAGGWLTAPDRFDAGKTVRFLSSSVYSTDQLKQDVYAWLSGKGLNPQCFEVWDERTGPRGAEAGNPISSVANIKVAEPYRNAIPADVTFTDRGGVKAVARAKFNADGSLYIWLDKGAEAALKYGALAPISAGGAPAEENPFG
jgi:hypothetical protein